MKNIKLSQTNFLNKYGHFLNKIPISEFNKNNITNINKPFFNVIDEYQNYISLPVNCSGGDDEFYDKARETKSINKLAYNVLLNNFQNNIIFRCKDKGTKDYFSEIGLPEDMVNKISSLKDFQSIVFSNEYDEGYVSYVPRSWRPLQESWFDWQKEVSQKMKKNINQLFMNHLINTKGQIERF